jgi:hypothetical protein
MIFSDLASLAEASNERTRDWLGFAQAENRFPPRIKSGAGFFRIMLYGAAAFFPASKTSFGNASR